MLILHRILFTNNSSNFHPSRQKDDDPVVETEPQKKTSIKIEDVRARNKQILLELENAKANLRSKAIFSPSEMQWQRIYQNYNQVRSMPVTTYKCHNAIYV